MGEHVKRLAQELTCIGCAEILVLFFLQISNGLEQFTKISKLNHSYYIKCHIDPCQI